MTMVLAIPYTSMMDEYTGLALERLRVAPPEEHRAILSEEIGTAYKQGFGIGGVALGLTGCALGAYWMHRRMR